MNVSKIILIFYNKLKDSNYKVEHYSLNNFKVIFDNITLTLEKDKSLTDRIEELEEENKSIKELLIEIKNNDKCIRYDKYGYKTYYGSKSGEGYGIGYQNDEIVYKGYFKDFQYYGEGISFNNGLKNMKVFLLIINV